MIVDVYGKGERLYCAADDGRYKPVEDPQEWEECPKCGFKPLIWEFDNGRFTACGCGEGDYEKNHLTIRAESIGSYLNRLETYKSNKYKSWYDEYNEELKNNWNTYCETGDTQAFDRKKKQILEEQNIEIW